MTKSNYTTTIIIDQSPAEAYNAINQVHDWWQGEIEGSTDNLNDEFIYRMKDIHYSKQKLVEMIPNEKVVWLVTDSQLNFAQDKSEWTGKKLFLKFRRLTAKRKSDLHNRD